MKIRDRIKELRRVPASQLRPNPNNWRRHPTNQQNAMRAMLAEVGYADALLARETEEGDLMLIDGHLRAETTPDAQVPVLILDVTPAEADKLLALHDPIGALASAETPLLAELAARIDTESAALRQVLDDITVPGNLPTPGADAPTSSDVRIPDVFQVVVDCSGEAEQQSLYERLAGEGFACRVVTL